MNIKLLLLLVTAIMISVIPHVSYTGGGQPTPKRVDFCTNSVFETCTVANVALNAVGDKVNYVTNKLKMTENFGKISSEVTKEITIPLPNADFVKSAKLYAFTPTVGSRLIKDQEIKLLVVSTDLSKPFPDWTPKSVIKEATDTMAQLPWAQFMIKVYFQRGDEPKTQWTELGASFLDKSNLNLTNPLYVKMKIQPDAKITMILPARIDEQGNKIEEKPLEGDLSKLN